MKVTLESRKTGLKQTFDNQEEADKFVKVAGPGKHKVAQPDEVKTPPEARTPAVKADANKADDKAK